MIANIYTEKMEAHRKINLRIGTWMTVMPSTV